MADEEMKGIPDEIKEEMEDDWSGDDGSGEDDASGTIEGNEDDGDEEEEEEEDDAEEDGETGPSRVYLPGDADDAEKAGDLVCDESAYAMYHTCGTMLPCLSFDVILDTLGDNRTTFPASYYCIAGSQAAKANQNSLLVMKMSNLTAMEAAKDPDEEESDEEDSEDEDELPALECAQIRHIGSVNRIKYARVNTLPLAASFSETGKVHMWNLTNALRAVEDPRVMANFKPNNPDYSPFFTFSGHKTEGFALNWSKAAPGYLATGDCNGLIHVWTPGQGGQWNVDQTPYRSHTGSVEDIQWSPNEPNVFASCSADKSIQIWDIREKNKSMLTAKDAHTEDVNVIHWNPTEPFIVSGSDAGDIKIWDLRRFKDNGPAVAVFRHHRGPICSIEWHPTDSTVFAAAGEDNQLTQWDIAVEKGEDEPQELESVPPQLLFIHQGQTEIKELHWHPQMPGVMLSSALNGIDIFKTISV